LGKSGLLKKEPKKGGVRGTTLRELEKKRHLTHYVESKKLGGRKSGKESKGQGKE